MAPSATPADSPTAAALQLDASKGSERLAAALPNSAEPSSSGSRSGDANSVPLPTPNLQLFAPGGASEASGGAPGCSGSPAAAVRHRQGARQSALANRSTLRPKVSRAGAVATALAAPAGEHQQEAADFPTEDGELPKAKYCNSSSSCVAASEASPAGRVGRLQRVPRLSVGGTPGAGTEEGGSRSLRRGPTDAVSASAGTGVTVQAAGGAPAGADPMDYRGLRRSLRQALLATSGKTYSPAGATGCASGGVEGQQNSSALGAPAAPGAPALPSITNASGVPSSGGKRRMRQAQKQLLQSYVVGQQHQQVGPQEEGQDTVTCLAEWLGIESNVPSCCCGSGCASCSVKSAAAAGTGSSSSNSNTLATSHASRGGSGGTMRSVLDVYATAGAKRQKQLPAVPKHQRPQHQRPTAASQREQENAILVSPSWFEVPADTEAGLDSCILRPASPSRPAAFFAQQGKWEAEDKLEAAEAAAASAGTPWPKGSTSCSFGGYGAATRCGGAVPLCCYCGLPLRPPAGSLRGQGAESGCPLTAAAAAAANLGMEGWTQWCRCCTRVYGDLRLQHQRDASWLPFTSFVVPKAPLRYVMLPADGAKDTPGGAQSIAAALAAAAAAESRKSKATDDSTATAVAAEGDSEPAVAQAGTSGNICSSSSSSTANTATSGSLRRTRSGQHFSRAPPARSGGRNSSNPTDIMRFLGASCCWPSCNSEHSFVQPIARLQQQLTHLQQQFSEQPSQPHLQQQTENQPTPCRVSHEEGFSSSGAQAAVPDEESSPTAAPAAAPLRTAETSSGSAAAPGTTTQNAAAVYGGTGSERFSQSEASLSGVDVASSVDAPLSTPSAQAAGTVKRQCCSTSVQDPPAEAAQGKTGGTQTAARTVVIPRVYLESKTSCYVATAFDAPRKQLLQKRFCCSILGEQRAHALACQWLRWVQRWRADTSQKPRALLAHP